MNGGLGSWEAFDINPGADFEAAICDASISPDNEQLVIAVSGSNKGDKTKTKLYNVAFQCPTLACDADGKLLPSAFDSELLIIEHSMMSTSSINRRLKHFLGKKRVKRLPIAW